jgi:hypothetical protein
MGLPYRKGAELCAKAFDRKHGKGTFCSSMGSWDRFARVSGKRVRLMYLSSTSRTGRYWNATKYAEAKGDYAEMPDAQTQRGMTVKSVGKRFPKGRFIVLIRGHAIGFKNGEIMDWSRDVQRGLNSRVEAVIKVY